MNLKKKCQVVMLPTRKANLILSENNMLVWDKSTEPLGGYRKDCIFTPQHIYILSDDEIKEGDWYLEVFMDTRIPKKAVAPMLDSFAKKIIATTDTSLFGPFEKPYPKGVTNPLPEPSRSFIEKYITEYNKGNNIKWINVDFTFPYIITLGNCIYKEINGDGSYYELINGEVEMAKSLSELANLGAIIDYLPKVDKNNQITITKIKDSWTREEVIEFGLKCLKLGMDLNNNPLPRLNTISGKNYYYKLIEENL